MNRAVIFDVNETMLDLGALDPLFVRWFGDPIARKEWFAQTLHFAMTLAATREFRSFGEVGAGRACGDRARRGDITPERSRRPAARGRAATAGSPRCGAGPAHPAGREV